jgi:hypothetical protein
MVMPSGKWYWECVNTGGSVFPMFGIARISLASSTLFWQSSLGYAYYYDGLKYNAATPSSYGASFTTNDIIGVAFDADAGTLTFYKNNVSQGVAFTGLTQGDYCPAIGQGSGVLVINDINFGQRPFAYTPPTGFKKLNTYNLPDSSIVDGSKNFDVALDTGANIKTASEALYTNQLAWIKDRINANNHQLIDSVRGLTAVVQSNTTAAETTYSAPSGSSVAWAWRASDSAPVSNTDGTNPSTVLVSANPTAGFSIVTYNPSSGGTVGHGLGTAPELIIDKKRDAAGDWIVQTTIIDGSSDYLRLNTTAAAATLGVAVPTATVYTPSIGSGASAVAYCFTSVEGFSKIGTYTGNGSADGPFVYTGFKPAFVLCKRTDGVVSWVMFDTSRDTYNVGQANLYPNLSNAEGTGPSIDFLSNGFKLRTASGDANPSGTVLYMAFAENPFKNSLAR